MAIQTSTTWRVLRAPAAPETVDHPDAWAYVAYSDVERAREQAVWGWTDLWAPPQVILGALRQQDYERKLMLVAVRADLPTGTPPRPDDVAGAAFLSLPREGNTHLAWASPRVRPELADQGVLEALLAAVEEVAQAEGRTTVVFTTPHSPEPAAGPDALDAPTGAGRVPARAPDVRTALACGYTLEQIARHSTQALPASALDALHQEALAAAADEYRTLTWRDEVPVEWLDQLAVLWERMSTDAPSADLDTAAEPWDAERVRGHLAELAGRFQHVLVTVAEHVPTGTLVAFTVLQTPYPEVPFAFQEDTLVLREHRGRRLGTLVKIVNLRNLVAWRPGIRRIHTWNAEENEHMLAVNVALGYVGDGVAAVWQKRR